MLENDFNYNLSYFPECLTIKRVGFITHLKIPPAQIKEVQVIYIEFINEFLEFKIPPECVVTSFLCMKFNSLTSLISINQFSIIRTLLMHILPKYGRKMDPSNSLVSSPFPHLNKGKRDSSLFTLPSPFSPYSLIHTHCSNYCHISDT